MIGKVQSYTNFKGVYLKHNGKTVKNIKQAYNDLERNNGIDKNMTNYQQQSFNANLLYGLQRLNDRTFDDGQTRYLTLEPLYSDKNNLLSGYHLEIVDEDGNNIVGSMSYLDKAGVHTLKTAFDELTAGYRSILSKSAVENYTQTVSSLDSVVGRYSVLYGPDNA